MPLLGFHASHEQIAPSQLLADVRRAEQAGFTAAMCSDHWAPWSQRQGQSGFAWSWLGAALQATSLPMGIVTSPGQRYHPAIIAQAIATIEEMYPGRFWAAFGSGENLNEHITGDAWPTKAHRNERIVETADITMRLLDGDTVTHAGHVTVEGARLFTRPAVRPPLLGAAVSQATARLHATWADGLITVGIQPHVVAGIVHAYRDAGGTGPIYLQLHLSYAGTQAEALEIAHDQWRTNVFGPPVSWDLHETQHFDDAAEFVRPEDMHAAVRISPDLTQHAAWIDEYTQVGVDAIMLHHVGKDQARFIDDFGEYVLPQLRGQSP